MLIASLLNNIISVEFLKLSRMLRLFISVTSLPEQFLSEQYRFKCRLVFNLKGTANTSSSFFLENGLYEAKKELNGRGP